MQYAILIDFGTSSCNIIISLPLWSMVKVASSILVSFSTTTTDKLLHKEMKRKQMGLREVVPVDVSLLT